MPTILGTGVSDWPLVLAQRWVRYDSCQDYLTRLKDKDPLLEQGGSKSLLELITEESKSVQRSYISDLHTL